MKYSISTKINLAVVFSVTIAGVVIGAITYYSSNRTITTLESEDLTISTNVKVAQIKVVFDNSQDIVNKLAENPNIQPILSNPNNINLIESTNELFRKL